MNTDFQALDYTFKVPVITLDLPKLSQIQQKNLKLENERKIAIKFKSNKVSVKLNSVRSDLIIGLVSMNFYR